MSRLVNVSNRVALPGARADGGLAVGLLAAMQASGGLWFGWNGTAYADNSAPPNPSLQQRGNVSFATIPLPETALGRYYNGFANGTLWPLFHYFVDSFRYDPEQYAAYCHVNALFAAGLQPLLRPDDLVWVHDYHLIPLAEELHARGARVPIGFFLHIPFPNFEVLRALPVYRELLGQLLAFDLLGFQTERDRRGFLDGVLAAGIADGTDASGRILMGSRRISTGVFPIGVDAQAIARVAEKSTASTSVRDITLSLHGRRLIIGVDRLDYSKGLLERFDAYQKFLEKFPQFQGAVTYLQIAPLGRQNVTAYRRIRTALEQNAGRTNGRFGDVDWTPIRYLNRNFPHAALLGFLRLSQVCLVTPLRDGMNLVAKEFIAAQDPANPGVLILSDRAGAADQLSEALLVNPYDIDGIAFALKRALDMPLLERRERFGALHRSVAIDTVHAWWQEFVQALARAHSDSPLLCETPLSGRDSVADRRHTLP